ncbi:MAG TPA: heavy metal translocating P-type ATPase [Mobilitalea sp.]|nr:heavy metal translocating P-type ATPase [Mobilitalea sp.]
MNQKFNVTGMTCSACSASVEKSVRKLEGVREVNVNLLSGSMKVEFDEAHLDQSRIIEAVEAAGYGATEYISGLTATAQPVKVNSIEQEQLEMRRRIILSFLFLIPLLYITMGHMFGFPLPMFFMGIPNSFNLVFTQLLLTIPILYINRKYYEVGFKTLFHGSPNMDSLIAIGSAAAVFYGIFAIYRIGYGLGHQNQMLVEHYLYDLYFESAGTILTLITLGKYLEARSKGKTSEAISKLIDLAPKTAVVVRKGKEITLPVEQVAVNDILLVKPGQSIPVDGVIIEGNTTIDQAAITGESIPVEKQVGDHVIAATINKSGYIKFRAEKVGADTTLSKIIQLVEEASSSKAPISKLADKISGIFVPVVISIAILSAAIWLLAGQSIEFALSIGIAVLVISCPCALGLATPVAIMVGTGKGAQNGILVKSAETLETLQSVNTVILDKTGTITEGKPRVTDIIPASDISRRALIEIAASIEKPSGHPLSEAIIEEAMSSDIPIADVADFQTIPGRGILAKLNGKSYHAGNRSYMQEQGIPTEEWESHADTFAKEGKTPLYYADGSKLLGMIAVADVIKTTSFNAISELKSMGIEVIMLTGDNKKTAEAIRSQLNLEKVIAEVLPEDKEREVRKLQEKGGKVAMVGDGINDAPALVRADVGIAIGAGTDIAIESADIVLMKSNLKDVVTAIKLSKVTMRNIRQNLFWAFFYNTLGIPLAAGLFYTALGWKLSPIIGAAAMSLSSVFVVTNALRLRFFKA